MTQQNMADAAPNQVALAAEYNKVTANVRELDTRLTVTESAVTNGTSGNAALNTRVASVEGVTSNSTSGNAALNTRVGTLETNQGTRGANGTVYSEIGTLKSTTTHATSGNSALNTRLGTVETRTMDGTTGNAALGTRVGTLETNQGTRGAMGTVYAEIAALKAGGGGGGGTDPAVLTRLDTLEANQGTRGANGPIYTELGTLKTKASTAETNISDVQTMLSVSHLQDFRTYGDKLAPFPRHAGLATDTVDHPAYIMVKTGLYPVSVSNLRVAFTNTGLQPLNLRVYTGSDSSNLSAVTGVLTITPGTQGIGTVSTGSLTIPANTWVAVGFQKQGATAPRLITQAGQAAAFPFLANSGTIVSIYDDGKPVTNSTLNMNNAANFSGTSTQFWWALL